MAHRTISTVLFLGTISVVTTQTEPLYPISGYALPPGDDGSSSSISLYQSFPFFGKIHENIYVNQNGHLTFDRGWSSYLPEIFPLNGSRDIIAPYWTDLYSVETGTVSHNQFTSGSVLQQATQDINEYFPQLTFNASWVFVATWHDVAYYSNVIAQSTFQAVLISGGHYSFVMMNYGKIAPTNQSVQAGYDTIDSTHYFTIAGSFSSNHSIGSYLTLPLSSNVNVSGRWVFMTNDGIICPANSHYEDCGTYCPRNCSTRSSTEIACITLCWQGCQCDDGFVLNGSLCVPTNTCGCQYQGQHYQNGQHFWADQECESLCICNGTTGTLYCTPSSCGPHESCRMVGNEYGCHGTCSASGDPHYRTFDHRSYDFQGTCRYVLAKMSRYTYGRHRFSVEAKNEPLNGLSVSITAEVFVKVFNYEIHLSRNSQGVVQVDGITRNLPVTLPGGQVYIYASGSLTSVTVDFGLIVTYDGSHRVSISLPLSYRTKTAGLCGNFNGNPDDDFRDQLGRQVATPDAFGASWKVPGYYNCSDGCGSSCPRCTNDLPARTQCAVIQAANGTFSLCHEKVDPTPYFNDCVFDVCVLGNDFQCKAIQAYVSACQSANAQIQPWRTNTTCPLACPANSHYELCGKDCGNTCAMNASCAPFCTEGCFCDEGFLRSGTTCVPVESCGCELDGFYYNAGESFWTTRCAQRCECHGPNDVRCSSAVCRYPFQCTIRNGQLGCFDRMSTCTVWGDPHYRSFDGSVSHFQGTCSYIAAKRERGRYNDFTVIATNNHRGNNQSSFVSAVDIHLRNQRSTNISIGANKIVKINGRLVSLPTNVGYYGWIMREGSYIVVDIYDLIVHFDGRGTLLIRVNRYYQNAVTGMCGNFNDDPADDKVFPNGTLAQNDKDFGNSWKSITSQPGCGSTDDDSGDGLDDCLFMEEYSQHCSVITNTSGPFRSCHLHSDPQPFFMSCVYDLCRYTQANGMLCSAVSAYERTCTVLELEVSEWRSALQCPESDPCEQLNCTGYEWCGENNGIYGCFCGEHYAQANIDSYDSSIECFHSSGQISLSRCQLFEAGFHPLTLHLIDESCNGTLHDGRLYFYFDNDEHQCGTVLETNETHLMYKNSIQSYEGFKMHLDFYCEYPMMQVSSLNIGIDAVESILRKMLPGGHGAYYLTMTLYQDPGFNFPLTRHAHIEIENNHIIYVEVRADGVDEQKFATILESCWATPINNADYHERWTLINMTCPSDDSVEIIHNGISTVTRFSLKITAIYPSIYLHCHTHLCLLSNNNCAALCSPYHHRVRRELSYHDSVTVSLGPLVATLN